jgi:chaperone modulatory protein CbpM
MMTTENLDNSPISFEELCRALQTEQQFVIELVELHVLRPQGQTHTDWRFDSYNFRRARMARSFYHELEVNLNGIALALDLLDEIDRLKRTSK